MNIEIRLKFTADKTLKRSATRIGRLSQDSIAEALKTAMQRTLIEGIRQRMLARGEQMVLVDRAAPHSRVKFNGIHARQQLLRIQRNIAKAQANGDRREVNRQINKQREVLRKFTAGAKPKLGKAHTESAKQLFRALNTTKVEKRQAVQQVRKLLTGKDAFVTEVNGDSITVGVGVISVLDQIYTPSATRELTGRFSDSPFKKLWLQMEFGAGLYRKPNPLLHNSIYKTGVGSWWYGSKAGRGIHFIGQKPGNFLRDRTGLRYTKDGLLFERVFKQQMLRMLFGG